MGKLTPVRLAAPSALVLVVASMALAGGCQLDYEIVEADGLAGSGSDLVGLGGGPPGNAGGANGAGGAGPGVGGLGGADGSGGAPSGGASTAGGAPGSGGATASGGGATASGGGGSGGSGGTNPTLTVTTDEDEEDAGAIPSNPGQTGFSLREAILYANQEAGHNEIIFQSQYSIDLTSPLPTVTDTARIYGEAGAGSISIQGAGAGTSAACLSVNASDVTLESLWFFDCPAAPVSFEPGSGSGNVFTSCFVQNNGAPATFHGDGPVVLFNYWDGADAGVIEVYATDAQILANRIENPVGPAIVVADGADDAFLLANAINSASIGIDLGASDGARLWHNTVVGSDTDGLSLTGTTGVDFRNNVVVGSNQFGVDGSSAQFTLFDYNLYFDNTSGDCSSCTLAANDLTSDPLFDSDYTPQTSSPAIDSGFDLGDDRNLGDPGLFNGTGPDRGYIETP